MAFPTTSVLHAFTGTDGTDLNVYSADYQSAPTSANPMEIQGNAATGSVNTAYNANFLSTSYGPDSENFITVTTLPSTGYPVLLPIRCANETSMSTLDGYCLYYVDTSLSVQRIDNGVLTQLGSAATQTISVGDSIGIECQSSSHRMYYKASGGSWGQVGSTQTDSTYSAAGKIGLYSYGTTVRLDDHGGGTLSATQTLTPSLVTNTQTFHAPTVGRGAVTLTPSLVTNSQTFYGPTVSSSYGLTPSLVTNSQTFYGPTVSAGAVTLQPSLVTNTQTFYSPTVSSNGQQLLPSLVVNEQTFYASTVSVGPVTLQPSLVTNQQMFFGPVVSFPGAASNDAAAGGGGGTQKKRKKLAVLEVDGKEYVIPADDIQSFLNSLVKPDKKKQKKQEVKKPVPVVAPEVRIVEVAPEIERVVVQKVDRTNELLLAAWNRAIERELEEEEELIWLLVA